MGIRESLLNTITSVADSDFVRVVTSAGVSSKATVRNLFKGFESNLSAKSSLSDSDYIRLVGSDNEAYKQSVSSVYDAIGVKFLGAFTASSDEDTIKAALTALKTAYSSEASSSTNKPKTIAFFRSGAWGFVGTAWIRNNTVTMTVTQNYNGNTYFGRDDNGTQTVTLMPTRSELTNITTNTRHDVNSYCDMFIKPSNTSGYPNTTLELRPQKSGDKNLLQIYVNGVDYGYILFDVSRNVGTIV